ncbi:MAG: heme A synthase [Acidobacteria bacterium]|nr:heme A synthase [Acidobacteriota bacterium]
MLLHLFTLLVAAATALLIFAGGLVTSTGSGLSVPDWPSTYGWFMFTFPLDKMVGGIFYEHSHRLIASTVGFLIVILTAWLWRAEPRAWVRRLGYLALAAVVTQGILGGITVLWFLPDPISIAHAGLAQLVFCLTVSIAVVTSPGWRRAYERRGDAGRGVTPRQAGREGPSYVNETNDGALQRLGIATTVAIFAQILIGATMRHTDAGLAIPDFPLAFGRLLPPFWSAAIAVHYAHRVGALVVAALILAAATRVFVHQRVRVELRRPSVLLLVLVVLQIALGALTVLSGKQYIVNSLHVVVGALVLATSLVLTLRAHRPRFGIGDQGSGMGETHAVDLRIPDPQSRIPGVTHP